MITTLGDTILIGDQREIRFSTKVRDGEEIIFEPPANPLVKGVELITPLTIDTVAKDESGVELEGKVVITSFDSGSYQLPPFIAYKIGADGAVDTLSFDGGYLHVETIQIDTASYQPFDLKGQLTYPITAREILGWAALSLAVIALIYLAIRGVKRLFKKREDDRFVGLPPHVVALARIEELREGKVWLKDQKLYFSELTDLLRLYIEHRYLFGALEMTSAEILDLLSPQIEREHFKELSSLFSVADLVKFAKYEASTEECEKVIPYAIKFVNMGYQTQIEESEEDEPSSEDSNREKEEE